MTKTVTRPGIPAGDAEEQRLHGELVQRMRVLSFPAYCHLIRFLLYRSGYTSVQVVELDRIRQGRDPSPADSGSPFISTRRLLYSGLIAVSHTDLASVLTLVRVKQAKGDPVSPRFVDQLRGAMLRLGAEQGVLITTGRFSRYALAAATQPPLPPVRLIDGAGLCNMLVERGLGVASREYFKGRIRWQVDEPFFELLERRAQASMPALAPPESAESAAAKPAMAKSEAAKPAALKGLAA